MKKIKLNLPTEKELELMNKKQYEDDRKVVENISYWFPEINIASNLCEFNIPKTKIITLPYHIWENFRTETPDLNKIKDFLINKLKGFEAGKKVFLKTGVFSNKFTFKTAVLDVNRESIAEQFYEIFYASAIVGAGTSSEVAIREFIESKENLPTIYEGMPLHTEFRVFYDFDEHNVVGIVNYWNEEIMTFEKIRKDYPTYLKVKDKINYEYNEHKGNVIEKVKSHMKHVKNLTGQWSVDIMKTGDEYWLIDMARMERSALVKYMESCDTL